MPKYIAHAEKLIIVFTMHAVPVATKSGNALLMVQSEAVMQGSIEPVSLHGGK